jgi:hypothetical protein
MTDDLSNGNDLFDAIKRGHLWGGEQIAQEIKKYIEANYTSNIISHSMRWDSDDKYRYIYDNECYLFIFEKMIELRCDRDDVYSSHQTIEYPIKSVRDIEIAYERFSSMTMENEDEN